MDPLKNLFLLLSQQTILQNLLSTSGPGKIISKRFISGETMDEGINTSRELNRRGILVTLDHLGESVLTEAGAKESVQEYLKTMERLQREKLDTTVSLKLTQLGLDINYDLCLGYMRQIMQRAKETRNWVTIDMESSLYTDRTLRIYQTLVKEGHAEAGIVIQAYLRKSESDIKNMLHLGPRVRLCKGAYQEPKEVAFPRKKDVDRNYLRLLGILLARESLARGTYPEVATHDERIIKWTINLVKGNYISRDQFEFQMLYGVRRDLQERLVRDHYRLRVYVPYGTHWYPYFMRRLAERPANLVFIAKSLLRR